MITEDDVASIEASMTAKAKAAVISNGDWLTAQEVSPAEADTVLALHDLLRIEHDGKILYPSWALDGARVLEPLRTIVDLFRVKAMSNWNIAMWFASDCSRLGGHRPQDMLRASPMDVIAAVEDEIMGIAHG